MRILSLAAGVAAVLSLASLASAQASLPLVERFNYPAGNLTGNTINGGTWAQTGNNSASPVQVTTGSLSYSGLPASVGNKVVLLNGSNYEDPGLDITPTTSTVYASFILNVVNPGNTTGDYFFNFSSAGSTSTDYKARVFVRQGSAGAGSYNIGLRGDAGAASPQVWSSDITVGSPIFVVVAYQFNPATNDDMTYVWLNPPLGQASPVSADLSSVVGTDIAAVGRVNLRQGSSSTSMNLELDELRVSTSWQDVTPSNASVGDWSLY
jgi:hypothetical protein